MLLAVAVFLLQFQPATPADSASTSGRSASVDRTRAKTADSTADIFNSASGAREKASEESSSLSGAASVKMDSIYPDDKLSRTASPDHSNSGSQ